MERGYPRGIKMDEETNPDFSSTRAELFESLGHPTRMRILQALGRKPTGFSELELKQEVGISSSGHLSFHLSKPDHLVGTTPAGAYSVTEDGKEAIRMMEVTVKSEGKLVRDGTHLRGRSVERMLTAALLVAVLVIGSGAVYQQQQIANLSSSISSLQNRNVSLTQNVTSLRADEGIIVTCEASPQIRPQDVNISTRIVLVMPAGGTANFCVSYTALHEVYGGSNALLPDVVDLARVTSSCISCGAIHSILVNSTGTHSIMVAPLIDSLTVMYRISTPENSTGFYALWWSGKTCGFLTLVVSTNAYSGRVRLNASDFANFSWLRSGCPAITISAVSITMVRGVTAQYVKCDLPTCVVP